MRRRPHRGWGQRVHGVCPGRHHEEKAPSDQPQPFTSSERIALRAKAHFISTRTTTLHNFVQHAEQPAILSKC